MYFLKNSLRYIRSDGGILMVVSCLNLLWFIWTYTGWRTTILTHRSYPPGAVAFVAPLVALSIMFVSLCHLLIARKHERANYMIASCACVIILVPSYIVRQDLKLLFRERGTFILLHNAIYTYSDSYGGYLPPSIYTLAVDQSIPLSGRIFSYDNIDRNVSHDYLASRAFPFIYNYRRKMQDFKYDDPLLYSILNRDWITSIYLDGRIEILPVHLFSQLVLKNTHASQAPSDDVFLD